MTDARTSPLIGTTLSHYKILSKLGEGGMGEVYLAEDTELRRSIALKILPDDMASVPDRLERFRREARTVAALDHPNIVTIHSVEEAEGVHFLTMSLIEGQTLDQVIHSGGLDLQRLFDLAIPLADALAAAHAKGITHRDLKPANVMVTPEGRVKVLDFGLAKLAAADNPEDEETQALTQEGLVVGTVQYMSPEQAKGERVDQRTDVFSLGVLLYEMATGIRPFQGKSSVELLSSILKDDPAPVTQLRGELPNHLGRLIQHCLEKDPDRRLQTAVDVRNELEQLEGEVFSGQARPSSATAVGPSLSAGRWRPIALLASSLVLAVVVGVVAWRVGWQSPLPGDAPVSSIAVLPLENLSGDPGQEYFSDGMTESLITDLAKIGALRVIARPSVMPYKNSTKSLREIGEELGVDAVVVGSAMLVGDAVRITAQLIETDTEQHLWAQSYQRDLSDILSLQGELAQEIAEKVSITLTPGETTALARARTVDPEAHRAYLRGRYALNKFTPTETRKAIDLFKQAIDLDPTAAPSYAGLSDAYAQLRFLEVAPHEVMPGARAAALTALELDPELAEAHAALGVVKLYYDYDWDGAEAALKRAIELNPNLASAHFYLSLHLNAAGRSEEAYAAMDRAKELDPLSPLFTAFAAWGAYMAHDWDRALEEATAAINLEPNFWLPHVLLGIAYEKQEKFPEAIAAIEHALELQVASPVLEMLGGVFAAAGQPEKAREVLARFIELADRQYVCAYEVATVYAGLGDTEEALDWFEKGVEDRADCMPWARTDPKWDSLRDNPRFQDLLLQLIPGG